MHTFSKIQNEGNYRRNNLVLSTNEYEENRERKKNPEIKRRTNPMQCVTLFGFQIK